MKSGIMIFMEQSNGEIPFSGKDHPHYLIAEERKVKQKYPKVALPIEKQGNDWYVKTATGDVEIGKWAEEMESVYGDTEEEKKTNFKTGHY